MPFQPGNTEASKKGKHEKTKQWETLCESIMTTHTERFNSILANCEDDKFLTHYTQILEYFKPKLQRSEQKIEAEIKSNVKMKLIDGTEIDL